MLETILEILLDPLGALVITFFVLSIITIVALTLMYLLRNEKVKKGIFYFAVGWSIIVTWCNLLMAIGFELSGLLSAFGLGALGIGALLYQIFSKRENKFLISRILVTISIVAGMMDCFII